MNIDTTEIIIAIDYVKYDFWVIYCNFKIFLYFRAAAWLNRSSYVMVLFSARATFCDRINQITLCMLWVFRRRCLFLYFLLTLGEL